MARRPSTVSLPSSSSASTSIKTLHSSQNVGFKTAKPQSNGRPVLLSRTASLSTQLEAFVRHDESPGQLNPEDLFAKYSVSEMRSVQQRLRADADAKQEELRLMVGERYRDLLQASSSIMSIAQSSKRVLEVFDEMKETARHAEAPRISKRAATSEDDKQLKALQSLSAHLKLLLDAPEHLWRLLERRMYLHAAWLFLLARVVHRGLLQDDDDTEKDWEAFGIDVSEQFPIVQRQWDAVSQFRSQITHKATLSLREPSSSSGEVCGVLLTLHLLESRPLAETLSIFLSQRTRTLSSLLSSTSGRVSDGPAKEDFDPSSRSRKVVLREVKLKLETLLSLIVRTLETARAIFSDRNEKSLMKRALEAFQSDEASSNILPDELRLTTAVLLSGLPSSTHLLLLPDDVKSHKPYVDISSPTASMSPPQLRAKLDEWFRKALGDVQTSVQKWFSSLESIREVWDVRTQGHDYLNKAAVLEIEEKTSLSAFLDEVSQKQAITVWKSSLAHAEAMFREHLSAAIAVLSDHKPEGELDARPADYLFRAPPLASVGQSGLNPVSAASTFQKYKSAIKQQSHGRTPLLDDVLTTLERDTRKIHNDLQVMQRADKDTSVATSLTASYRPDAQAMCTRILVTLRQVADDILQQPEPPLRNLVFIGRITDHYSTSADFVVDVGCDVGAAQSIRDGMGALCDTVLDAWSESTIRNIINDCISDPPATNQHSRRNDVALPSRPSPGLLRGLRSLSTALQQVELRHPQRQQRLVKISIQLYIKTAIEALVVAEDASSQVYMQRLWDFEFLRVVVSKWESVDGALYPAELQSRIDCVRQQLVTQGISKAQLNLSNSLSDYVSRIQTLIYPLLPQASTDTKDKEKLSSLLHHGMPAVEQNAQPVLDLVKPSARFGLLLVGSDVQ